MLRSAICLGATLGVAVGAFAIEPPAAEPAERASAAESAPKAETPAAKPAAAEPAQPASTASKPTEPARDSKLIEVPSNTLGPGVPLWMRREQEQAYTRMTQADADYAEALADQAYVQARRAVDDPYYGDYGGVVVYGPHLPGLQRALINRPVPPAPHRADGPGRGPRVTSTPVDDDPFDAAQRQFYEISRPQIGPIIERQQDAQRRFGNNAYPSKIVPIQRGIDDAVIRARRGAPKPQNADK